MSAQFDILVARLAKLEGQLNQLFKHFGLTYDPRANAPAGVAEALDRGDTLDAIRCYRAATLAGLAEAKACGEALATELRAARGK
jgi:hypothetical protein